MQVEFILSAFFLLELYIYIIVQIDCTIESYLCTRSWTLIEKGMGLFDFLFSSGVSNSQKKAHRNAGNNTSSDHENYARGYEDGYDDCCCEHDCSYEDYHDSNYCDRDEYEGIENDECYDDNCDW